MKKYLLLSCVLHSVLAVGLSCLKPDSMYVPEYERIFISLLERTPKYTEKHVNVSQSAMHQKRISRPVPNVSNAHATTSMQSNHVAQTLIEQTSNLGNMPNQTEKNLEDISASHTESCSIMLIQTLEEHLKKALQQHRIQLKHQASLRIRLFFNQQHVIEQAVLIEPSPWSWLDRFVIESIPHISLQECSGEFIWPVVLN